MFVVCVGNIYVARLGLLRKMHKGMGKIIREVVSIEEYKNLTGAIEIPKTKKGLSCATLILLALKEAAKVYGFDEKEYLKNVLKSIPCDVLNKNDRKYRKEQLKHISLRCQMI